MPLESAPFVRATLPLVTVAETVAVAAAGAKKSEVEGKSARRARLEQAVKRLAKTALLFAAVEAASRRSRRAPWLFASAAAAQTATGAFTWNVALYFSLRVVATRLLESGNPWHLHPAAILVSHALHNGMLVSQAESIDPGYLRLWLRLMSGYKTPEDWYADFHSDAAKRNERYEERQVGDERLRAIGTKAVAAFRRQLPFVAALYLAPRLISPRATIEEVRAGGGAHVLAIAKELCARIVRSSIVLACLPLTLTEFPCIYDKLTRPKGDVKPVRRSPMLHAVIASFVSTGIFLAEPEGRRSVLVAYTWWRGLEALSRKWQSDYAPSKEAVELQSSAIASTLAGLSVSLLLGEKA